MSGKCATFASHGVSRTRNIASFSTTKSPIRLSDANCGGKKYATTRTSAANAESAIAVPRIFRRRILIGSFTGVSSERRVTKEALR